MKFILFCSLALIVTATSSCNFFGRRVHGNGIVKTESRPAGNFNGIDVSGAIDVYIKQDSVSSVKVETDENLLEYIEIYQDGDLLRIRPRKGYNPRPTNKIKVYVSGNVFKAIEASGACNIYSENKIKGDNLYIDMSGSCDIKMELNSPSVRADLSGSCDIQLTGETRDLKVEGSGSTDIKCMQLMAENVEIDISGAGSADVYASVKLDVSVSGSGTVRYKGNATVSKDISGAGSVKKIDDN